jgi:DNA polymerase III delta prime subunit
MAFHTEYRPTNLDTVIGHESAVTRLKGIVASVEAGKKSPSALAFFGPTSAGKTTLARAFAAGINGLKNIGESRDYQEINAASERSIDDVRQMIQQSKFRPQHKKRVICIDEAQGLLSNAPAINAFLKPLEEPSKDTIWVICSMEPESFRSSEKGRAVLTRVSQFVLEPHTQGDMLKQASRIAKGEKMGYVLDEEKTLLKAVVRNCVDMRSIANTMEALQQYYEGLKEKPKMLSKENIITVLKSTESADDVLAVTVMAAVYAGQFKLVQRSLLDVKDGFMFVSKLMWLNSYVLNNVVLEGARHPKAWGSEGARNLAKKAQELKVTLGVLAACNANLVETKSMAQQFATSAIELLSARLYRLIKEIHTKE